jgi:hypothetical protein
LDTQNNWLKNQLLFSAQLFFSEIINVMIEYKNEYVSVPDYAKRCGITNRSAYHRIRTRMVSAIELDGFIFVNIVLSPPVAHINPHLRRGRKIFKKAAYVKMDVWHDVTRYAYAHKITAGVIFRRIITEGLDAMVIAGNVFFKPSQL